MLGTLHWDILRLYGDILAGLRAASGRFDLASVGIDSWGVDYGLLDAGGALLGNPVHYRDARTAGVAERVLAAVPAPEMYAVTGIQQLPFNTIYQLAAARDTAQLAAARTLLLIPDLIGYWLTGEVGAEITNASTTGLLDVGPGILGDIADDADRHPAGPVPAAALAGRPHRRGAAGSAGRGASYGLARPLPVVAVGSHDTASAVVARACRRAGGFAYISCGTWSLVGVELDAPVLTEASREANFTNEAGVDGTVRYLRNVMGLWVLQESLRAWAARGRPGPGGTARRGRRGAAAAGGHRPGRPRVPAARRHARTHRRRLPPDRASRPPDTPGRDHPVHPRQPRSGPSPGDPGRPGPVRAAVGTVHIVGGGARNALLCQLTADACGLPVIAGPAEAAALGNVLVQARALHRGPVDLPGMRALIRATQPLRRYEPGDPAPWQAAARRLAG